MTFNSNHPVHKHPYTTTVSGINVYGPDQFQAVEVRMSDIIEGLSKICRYNGQIDRFYSVAEHSVLVSLFAELEGDHEAIIPGLLHDAHEYVSGDYPSPQKVMVPALRPFEDGYEATVRAALALPPNDDPVWERVRDYDTRILHRELVVLRKKLPAWFDPKVERTVPSIVQPVGLEWREARQFFADRLWQVGMKF